MRKYLILAILAFEAVIAAKAQTRSRISVENYIETYKDIAISEMKRSGIPASITLAQGMLESDNGNSSLVKEGNNHFGIKCHDWKGGKIYHDDDARNECFRKYGSSDESFRDHSNFLLSKQRYSSLFEYKSTDYKNWAIGLKKAGYATSPTYAEKLIKIIDDNKLYLYDQGVAVVTRPRSHRAAKKPTGGEDLGFTIKLNNRPIYKRNHVEYVVARHGDTFTKLANELEMFVWEIQKYNELSQDSTLHDGQILFLQPKRRKAEFGNDYHTVQPGETLYTISQLYGVKSKQLQKLNRLTPTDTIKAGDVLNLRKKTVKK